MNLQTIEHHIALAIRSAELLRGAGDQAAQLTIVISHLEDALHRVEHLERAQAGSQVQTFQSNAYCGPGPTG